MIYIRYVGNTLSGLLARVPGVARLHARGVDQRERVLGSKMRNSATL